MSELNPTNYSERLSVQEAAEILGTGQEAVRKAMREGRLPHEKELHGHNVRYSTTRKAVEEYKHNRSGRVVTGYSKEAMQQYRDTLAGFFGSLEDTIKESIEIERARLDVDRGMVEEIKGLREEVRQRMALDRELLEEQQKTREAIEGVRELKEEEERPGFWARWFGGG